MPRLERLTAAQFAADGTEHTGRVFRGGCGHFDVIAAVRNSLSEAQELLAEADAMLSKNGVFIKSYYRADKER